MTKPSDYSLNRRGFLKMALGTGIAMGTGISVPAFVKSGTREGIVEESEKMVHTYCSVCSANCGLKAYVDRGRLVHLAGNPHDFAAGDPFDPQGAGGRLCVKGHTALATLYDPDRAKFPMKRTNPRKGMGEDPGFVKISWDEAIERAAEGLSRVIAEYGPESFMVLSRSNPYSVRLGRAIGTPNFVAHQSTCFTTQQAAWRAMVTGGAKPWTYDIENTRYILGFGWDGLGKGKNPHVRNATRALERGARMVILDPYKSVTASKAHEWHPIVPGTDLAFCLAMIHVIIEEKSYDSAFVDEFTFGMDKLRHFAKEYTPGWAAEITGIDAETIVRIAREFASTSPAHIPSHKRDGAGPNYSNSWKLAQAQIILNALVGTIDRPGGTTLPRNPSMPGLDAVFPPPAYPTPRRERIDGWEQDNPFFQGSIQGNFATLAHGILNEEPYPLKAALVRGYNTTSFPHAVRATEALASLDFMVCCEIYPSNMAHLADVVLPEPHWLEISGFGARSYHSTYPQIAVRLPAVAPLHETRGFGTIVMQLAEAMGYGEYFRGVSGAEFTDAQLRAIGTSWDELTNSPTGIWEDRQPFQPRTEFNTPSGKIELYSTVLEEAGYDPLPYWAPRREQPSVEYPYHFLIGRPAMHKMTQTQNNRLIMEVYPENFATMNAKLGQKLGIRHGDEVYVESRVGRIKLKARLIEGIRPDCVQVVHGFGHWSRDMTRAYQVGANDGDLIPDMTFAEMRKLRDPGMGACMTDFGVKVYKA